MSTSGNRHGLTVIEVMVAIAVLGTASVGVMSYQYFSNRQMKNAQVKITATQVTQLLIEDWKSVGGDENYDPRDLGMDFTTATDGDDTYELVINDVRLRISMLWEDVLSDATSGIAIRQIGVRVRWRGDLMSGPLGNDHQELEFTTYVRRDAGGD
jgi:prepilin-type N-terminal cleavage/methylation domain-containing protein